MHSEVLVIGAGPTGSTAAGCLAGHHDVMIIEEHDTPGLPIQCAGLITPRAMPEFARGSLINKIRGAKIHSPLGFTLTLDARDTKALVVDRARFDECLFHNSVDLGAEPLTGAKVRAVKAVDGHVRIEARVENNIQEFEGTVLIGCDGYRSIARSAAGIRGPRHMLSGFQVDLIGVEHDPDFVNLYMGNNVAPGFFAWSIPAGDRVRVGLCVWKSDDSPSVYLKKLLSRPEFRGGKKISSSAGKIPIGAAKTAICGNILLAGDAACHAKPLSGGGVFTGIRGAQLASECASRYLTTMQEDELWKYDRMWKDDFGRELASAFRIRKVFVSLSDKKMDRALRMFDDPEMLSLLRDRGDIDYPSSLSPYVLKLAPKLAHFSPQLIESLLK
ncbi:MAG: NAD(P)/FAD-dependent oxidoreductase [Methanomassiliicoccus sp.]|nr:MAG: NAD(P)/FAD-dependent oxidoreductase [Methanomassiliicoccus sp.]